MAAKFYDPTGERYGIPTYPFGLAPAGLLTKRQLLKLGLRPGGQDPVAQLKWRNGRRFAFLYDATLALPKRTPTPRILAAIGRALTARRTCPTCQQIKGYYIPTRYGECLTCAGETGDAR